MITIKKLSLEDFKLINFDLILGEQATYNEYFHIAIEHLETASNIGLQTVSGGLVPKAEILG